MLCPHNICILARSLGSCQSHHVTLCSHFDLIINILRPQTTLVVFNPLPVDQRLLSLNFRQAIILLLSDADAIDPDGIYWAEEWAEQQEQAYVAEQQQKNDDENENENQEEDSDETGEQSDEEDKDYETDEPNR